METWKFISSKAAAGIPVMLLYVLESKGSSPGRRGFKMAVAANGEIAGSIGGGIMEHKFVELAKTKLQQEATAKDIFRQVHDKASRDQSGMICSGEQKIFLYKLEEADAMHVNALVQSMENFQNGTLEISNNGVRFSRDISENDFDFKHVSDEEFILKERTGFKNRIHIIGGGHCSLALSRLMRTLDFHISVYEERPGLNTVIDNGYAHHKKTITSYLDLNMLVDEGDDTYVVIMTFGYRSDDLALRALMKKKLKYLGVLGSKKKIEKMFADFRHENVDEKLLSRIHAPIGVHIKSQTPAEIAVSIAAQIISIKNEEEG
jgi:xanthine dehydrogenase accessory factor